MLDFPKVGDKLILFRYSLFKYLAINFISPQVVEIYHLINVFFCQQVTMVDSTVRVLRRTAGCEFSLSRAHSASLSVTLSAMCYWSNSVIYAYLPCMPAKQSIVFVLYVCVSLCACPCSNGKTTNQNVVERVCGLWCLLIVIKFG